MSRLKTAAERNIPLRITLRGVEPPVWRQIVVPEAITLNKLHEVLQRVMGWRDSHLHKFRIDGKEYSYEDELFETDTIDETGIKLGSSQV